MDYKQYFQGAEIRDQIDGRPSITEDTYQAFKQRMIEELRVPPPHPFPILASAEGGKLIDTEQENKNRQGGG